MSRVLSLSEKLLASPKYLDIDRDRIEELAVRLADSPFNIPTWDFADLYPQTHGFEEACLFYLIFNSINYCYFDGHGNKFLDGNMSGSTLACLRLSEAWSDIKDPHFLANVDENFLLSELFQASSPISMVKERTNALRELGNFFVSNPDFSFDKFFRKYKCNAYFASQTLPTHLPSWRDPFFKRAQLFVGMVYGRFQNWKNLPIVEGLEDLTIFADYRVPQTLQAMGAINLHPTIVDTLQSEFFLESGSQVELELRAASVVASDILLQNLQNIRPDLNLNALHVDFLLWDSRRAQHSMPDGVFVNEWLPHHFTVTTDY